MSDEVALRWVLPLVFLVSGLFLLACAFRYLARTRAFLARAVETIGEVRQLTEEPPTEAGERSTYRPVVSFITAAGVSVEFASLAHSNPPEYAVGARVPILYDPERPNDARIRSFTSLWLLPLLLTGLGAAFTILGTALLLGAVPL